MRPSGFAASLEASLLTAPQPTAALALMLFVRWAEESCGARLPPAHRAALESIQAHLLTWFVVRDRVTDDGARGGEEEIVPLFRAAKEKLRALFAARSPFWPDYRRLSRQQWTADRWEQTCTGPVRFDASLIRRLGRKSALGRWPAAAVATLLGRPAMARRIDRDFEHLLAALQLFDDAADAEEDATSGQINAVLAAASREKGLLLHARIVRGIPPVYAAARTLLRGLTSRAGGLGRFARLMLDESKDAERHALERARARGIGAILERLLGEIGSHGID